MKLFFLLIMIALQGCLVSSGNQEETGSLQTGSFLYESLEDEKLAGIGEELPDRINVVSDDNGETEIVELTDEEEIEAAVQLFMEIQIGEKTDLYVTDRYNSISFIFADGTKTVISLNDKNLEWKEAGELYELEGIENFWRNVFTD